MTPEVYTNPDGHHPPGQGGPPAEPTPDPTIEARQEEQPLAAPPVPPPAFAPIAPRVVIATSQHEVSPAERWRIGLGLGSAAIGGLSWIFFGYGIRNGNLLLFVLALLPALWCLAAGWLLRSWWGFVLAPVVYAGVTFLTSIGFGGLGGIDWAFWTRGFALYIVLPAVVMSAIGTSIGMYRARRGGQQHTPQIA